MRRITAALSAIVSTIAGVVISIVTLPFRVLQRLFTPSRRRSMRSRRRTV
ncbi:LPFR motif small protein [Actinomadura spongiicola]|nr:LPFR motif small protein [Actinomadura spongiicola]